MNLKSILAGVAIASAALVCAPAVQAESVTLGKTIVRGVDAPVRGLSMAQVERRFGAPLEKMPAAGGDAPLHPVINRWRYGGYIVYFERNRVIHSVIDGSLPNS